MTEMETVRITPAMGRRLAMARDAMRLSQQDLADRLGASVAQIAKYERGELDMPIERLFDMAAILGIPPGELFG